MTFFLRKGDDAVYRGMALEKRSQVIIEHIVDACIRESLPDGVADNCGQYGIAQLSESYYEYIFYFHSLVFMINCL